jgi:hypothetical protein
VENEEEEKRCGIGCVREGRLYMDLIVLVCGRVSGVARRARAVRGDDGIGRAMVYDGSSQGGRS